MDLPGPHAKAMLQDILCDRPACDRRHRATAATEACLREVLHACRGWRASHMPSRRDCQAGDRHGFTHGCSGASALVGSPPVCGRHSSAAHPCPASGPAVRAWDWDSAGHMWPLKGPAEAAGRQAASQLHVSCSAHVRHSRCQTICTRTPVPGAGAARANGRPQAAARRSALRPHAPLRARARPAAAAAGRAAQRRARARRRLTAAGASARRTGGRPRARPPRPAARRTHAPARRRPPPAGRRAPRARPRPPTAPRRCSRACATRTQSRPRRPRSRPRAAPR